MKKLFVITLICAMAVVSVGMAQKHKTRTIYYVALPVFDEKGEVVRRVDVKVYAIDANEALSRVGIVAIDEKGYQSVRQSLDKLGVEHRKPIDYACVGSRPCPPNGTTY